MSCSIELLTVGSPPPTSWETHSRRVAAELRVVLHQGCIIVEGVHRQVVVGETTFTREVPNVSRPEMVKLSPEEQAEVDRQRAEVRKRYEGTDQWLKAPNGADSLLVQAARDLGLPDDYLWITVRTPFFKEWFGDWEKEGHPVSGNTSEDIAPFTSDLAQTSAVATGTVQYNAADGESQVGILDENGELSGWIYRGVGERKAPAASI